MEEWLTTVRAAELWEYAVGGKPTAFELPSGSRFMRMARAGELEQFGIRVTKFAGRYAIEKESLLEYIWMICAQAMLRLKDEMGEDWVRAMHEKYIGPVGY